MSDRGFDFKGFDNHAEHIFCRDRQIGEISQNFDLITMFEVAEHFIDPVGCFEALKRNTDNILFTTQIVPSPTPSAEDWWYYGIDHGQHISFYSLESLQFIAKKLGLHFYTSKNNKYNLTFHLFTKIKMKELFFRIIVNYQLSRVLYFARYHF